MERLRDDYLDVVRDHWHAIQGVYALYEEKKPIVLFDVTEKRIYAYPYREFAADLSASGQASLAVQYKKAVREGRMVVFVRDNRKRKLVSYSLDR